MDSTSAHKDPFIVYNDPLKPTVETIRPQEFLNDDWSSLNIQPDFAVDVISRLASRHPPLPSHVDLSNNRLASASEADWREIFEHIVRLSGTSFRFGFDVFFPVYKAALSKMNEVEQNQILRQISITGVDTNLERWMAKLDIWTTKLQATIERHDGWQSKDDEATAAEVNAAVKSYLKRKLSCARVHVYYALPGDDRKQFVVYRQDGSDLTDFDGGLLIPVESTGKELKILAVVEGKHCVTSSEIRKKLQKWKEFEQLSFNNSPKCHPTFKDLMLKFFKNRADYTVWYFIGGKHWSDRELEEVKRLGKSSNMGGRWHTVKFNGERFEVDEALRH